MRTIVLTSIAIAALSLAMTQPSVARNSTPASAPVSILTCDVFDQYAASVAAIAMDKEVQISFVNRSARTIRDVTFRVDTRDGNRTIGDAGRFSSGVLIQHTFGPFGDVDYDARCGVVSVTFEDGTVWPPTADQPPQSLASVRTVATGTRGT